MKTYPQAMDFSKFNQHIRDQREALKQRDKAEKALIQLAAALPQAKENAALRKANQATSAEFQAAVLHFVKELPHPQGLIYDLRWNKKLSQEKIVTECSRLQIAGCRTKKRVGELIKEIEGKAKEKGYRLSDHVTGPDAGRAAPTGYVGGIDGKTEIDTRTPAAILENAEIDKLVEKYREASKVEQSVMRKKYGQELVKELKARGIYP